MAETSSILGSPGGGTSSLAGRVLLALPDMPDPSFRRAAILMCAHDEKGALGIALGWPVEGLGLRDLLGSFDIAAGDIADRPVLRGGPVDARRGFVIHGTDWAGEDTLTVGVGLALSGSLDVLRALAAGEGPRDYLVALGYAGWSAGQLEEELKAPGWMVSACDPRALFETAPERRWAAAMMLDGIDPAMLSVVGGRA